ncbi:MAG: sulfatase-like hydrolase/transferase [Planctomycetota bacterium]|nr:sulfatase-like hydrolase/transferase [Planctomycetota bacterium]
MIRRQLLALSSLSLIPLLLQTPARAQEKPNFLFIFADDQAFDTVGALGNTEIETPNLDRLVVAGTTFTHAYNMGGYHGAICVASRTMFITGRYLWHARTAERTLKQEYQAKKQTWPQLLASAGYDTYFTGKWHVKADPNVVFKVARHVRGGMPRQTKEGYNRPIDGKPDPWSPSDPKFGGFWQGGKHWSEVVGDDACDYLDLASKSENPFFMYIAFNAPHDPRQAPKEYVDKYPTEKIALPKPFLPEYPFQIGSNRIRDERLAPFPRTENSVKVNRREYYAIISHMDAQIGRILEALKESGKYENTYIFFGADHGLAVGHHGLMGKQNMFDHSVRVPMMMVGPDIEKNKRKPARVYVQDIMPTTLELAGVPKPDRVQFKSLLPLVQGKTQRLYDSIYGAYTHTQRHLTQGDYKIILYPQIGKTLLFNLKKDPLETTDLAGNPEHIQRIAQLKTRLKKWQPVTGDGLDLDSPKPLAKKKKPKTKQETKRR